MKKRRIDLQFDCEFLRTLFSIGIYKNSPLSLHRICRYSFKNPKDFSSGFLYALSRINANTSKTLESTSFLYALFEFLIEKGLLTTEGLDERKRQVAEMLVKFNLRSKLEVS